MNHWTEYIDIWHIAYFGQEYSILVQMTPALKGINFYWTIFQKPLKYSHFYKVL